MDTHFSPPQEVDLRLAPLDELLTVDQVARVLKVSRSWVYSKTRKRGSGRLPHIKLGKYVRFDEHEVRAFLQRHKSR